MPVRRYPRRPRQFRATAGVLAHIEGAAIVDGGRLEIARVIAERFDLEAAREAGRIEACRNKAGMGGIVTLALGVTRVTRALASAAGLTWTFSDFYNTGPVAHP